VVTGRAEPGRADEVGFQRPFTLSRGVIAVGVQVCAMAGKAPQGANARIWVPNFDFMVLPFW
jgi:hypothetical protein